MDVHACARHRRHEDRRGARRRRRRAVASRQAADARRRRRSGVDSGRHVGHRGPRRRPVAGCAASASPQPDRSTFRPAPSAPSTSRSGKSHPASAGLRAKDFKLEKVTVFEPAADDGRIGEVDAGPVIVARPSKPKIVAFGFHPALSAMRYELTTPLLFANLFAGSRPRSSAAGRSAEAAWDRSVSPMDQDTPVNQVKVTAEDGTPLPFTCATARSISSPARPARFAWWRAIASTCTR